MQLGKKYIFKTLKEFFAEILTGCDIVVVVVVVFVIVAVVIIVVGVVDDVVCGGILDGTLSTRRQNALQNFSKAADLRRNFFEQRQLASAQKNF